MTKEERKLLADLGNALDHWLHQYAPEMCDRKYVVETQRAMFDAGGTLGYMVDLQQRIRAALSKRRRKYEAR